MKILENNYKSGLVRSCGHCKSVLEVELRDIKKDFEQDHYFKCPLCNHYNYVNIDEWFEKRALDSKFK